MSWQDIAAIASPLLSALTAGAAAFWAAWQAVDRKLENLNSRVADHETRLTVLDHDVRAAHRRLNDRDGRGSRRRDP